MRYVVTLLVEAERLGELITSATPLLAAPLQVVPEPTAPEPSLRGKHKRVKLPAGELQPSETRCGQAALEAVRTGPVTREEISAHLMTKKFSSNSASPIMSKLIKEGLVRRSVTSLNGIRKHVFELVA